ncbi:S8 family serine peptidase [Actinomadura sp. DC4]|uniref:S8 family serine peptidase n=1 Tax=Actinomadura sp. DC4 TaxID=3055069 RepID=UPI0025B15A76|nr:S8 family serine peptidase [Actinomadura sp. DC4]MDN3359716.1 S8 family serine peptidase [Actinomadura sp. DC4]
MAAAAAALGLTMLSVTPAGALPRPRADEWWFAPWAVKDIWKTTRGAGVTVAVMDSGVNARLPELSGAVLRGGDVTGEDTDGRTDFDKKNDGHGTAMSVVIAGRGGGTTGFAGIAPEAKILPIRTTHTGGVINSPQVIADGIRYAADHGAKVVNISLSVDASRETDQCPAQVETAIAQAIQHDVVIVAAAGDEGDKANLPQYPASCAGVLAVGAIDKYAQPWKGSERQDYVTIAAPGVDVGWVGQSGKYYPKTWGNSASAALISGGVALIRAANPQMPAREVVQRLTATAKDVGEPGRDSVTGYGVARIYHAMMKNTYPVAANAPNPVFERFDRLHGGRSAPPVTAPPAGKKKSADWATPVIGVILIVAVFAVAVFAGLRRRRTLNEASRSPGPEPNRRFDPAGSPKPGGRPDFLPPEDMDERSR